LVDDVRNNPQSIKINTNVNEPTGHFDGTHGGEHIDQIDETNGRVHFSQTGHPNEDPIVNNFIPFEHDTVNQFVQLESEHFNQLDEQHDVN